MLPFICYANVTCVSGPSMLLTVLLVYGLGHGHNFSLPVEIVYSIITAILLAAISHMNLCHCLLARADVYQSWLKKKNLEGVLDFPTNCFSS